MYHEDELEQFLQDEIKDHRMYPSDQVWRNIHGQVHGHQTWPALTFISIFIISALTVSTLLNNHPDQKAARLSLIRHLDLKKNAPVEESKESLADFNSIATEGLTAKTIAGIEKERMTREEQIITQSETPVIPMRFTKVEDPIVMVSDAPRENLLPTKPSFITEPANIQAVMDDKPAESEKPGVLLDATDVTVAEPQKNSAFEQVAASTENRTVAIPQNSVKTETAPVDDYLKEFAYTPAREIIQGKNSKFGFGFFITPSTSYRKLSDFKAKEILGAAPATAPVGLNYTTGINNIVRHKPAMGLELGFAVLYNMTNRLKFKTGVQFNIRQYYIETFQASTDITTISLVNNRGVQNISVFSPYNNNTGYRSTQLDNKMYQVSIPIGFQFDIIKGNHLGITAEASVQPTFTLNKSLYLLATDYKHYADGNSLMRKWNINSAFGINITYQSGVYQWYLGPQARFQHLPTYSNQYPITEYLMDYGIRLGFIKQIK